LLVAARALRALLRPPPIDGGEDEYEEERFTGSLMVADWYQRRVSRDEQEAKASKKRK